MSGEVVAITGIAAGGAGVGRLRDGRAVFVPRTTPGERVRLRDEIELHKNFAKGEVEEIVAAGAARVTPPCPHYVRDRCGGCQLQHLAYEAQLAAKRAIVGDALRRIGKLDLPDPEIVEAIGEWRYRAKISLAVRRPGGPAVGAMIGLHPYDRPGAVFALADCHIADFQVMALWRELRQRLELLPGGGGGRRGSRRSGCARRCPSPSAWCAGGDPWRAWRGWWRGPPPVSLRRRSSR